MTYSLNHNEYVALLRHLAFMVRMHSSENLKSLLFDLLEVPYDRKNLYFVVPEKLLQCIVTANLIDMALVQYRDSCGEIDYAGVGDHSETVLTRMLFNLI